jgi:hypothetical protein
MAISILSIGHPFNRLQPRTAAHGIVVHALLTLTCTVLHIGPSFVVPRRPEGIVGARDATKGQQPVCLLLLQSNAAETPAAFPLELFEELFLHASNK